MQSRVLRIVSFAFALILVTGWASLAATTWTVPGDFDTVNAAVDSASVVAGDTIQLTDASNEAFPIELDKAGITLECANQSAATIKVPNSHAGIVVRADNVTVKNCKITSDNTTTAGKEGDVAIVVKDVSSGVVIQNNTIEKIFSGIRLISAKNVTISGNTLRNIGSNGPGNKTGIAIFLEGSDSNTLAGNVVSATHAVGDNVDKNVIGVGDTKPSATQLNHCGEGLFLFLSDNNSVNGDIYQGCTTNGVTLNNSDNNTLENIVAADNGGWGVDISLSDGNALNNSNISRNLGGGIKLEGAQNNQVADPAKRGNNVHNNGDGKDEDIQILVTSGEKVLFTAPTFFKDGNKPDDPWDTEPNDVRTEKRFVRTEIDVLRDMLLEMGGELGTLKSLIEAEAGIIFETIDHLKAIAPQTQSTQLAEEKSRLLAKQNEIALEKVLIVACKIGIQDEVNGTHSVTDLPAWELQSALGPYASDPLNPTGAELKAFCVANLPANSLFKTDDDPFDKDGDGKTDDGPSYRTLEDKKSEIKQEIINIKDKLRRLEAAGILAGPCDSNGSQPDDCFELLQKLDTMIGVILDVNAELELILKKLIVADLRLPNPTEKQACFTLTTNADMQDCLNSFLTIRVPFTTALLGELGQVDLFTFSAGDFQAFIVQSGSTTINFPIDDPDNDGISEIILEPQAELEITGETLSCGSGVPLVFCTKTFTLTNVGNIPLIFNNSVVLVPDPAGSFDAFISCEGGTETGKLFPGESTECQLDVVLPEGTVVFHDIEIFINTTLFDQAVGKDSSVIDAKLWMEEAIAESDFSGKIADLHAWLTEFENEIPPPPFAINCVDIFKTGDPNGLLEADNVSTTDATDVGCLIGKKEQGGNSISGLGKDGVTVFFGSSKFQDTCDNVGDTSGTNATDVGLKCGDLVSRLDSDDQAQEFRQLIAQVLNTDSDPNNDVLPGKTWQPKDIEAHKIGGNRRESTGNVIANNVITTNVQAPGCNIPEKHPTLGSISRAECSIGIKVESPSNEFRHNWLTNEDVFPPTQAGEIGRMGIGIIVLASENDFIRNTCEEINLCVIKGGNNDREDKQHEHLFAKLAATKCGDLVDPQTCQRPIEKIIILEVQDETIFVSKPDDKCTEKTSKPRPGQVNCSSDSKDTEFKTVRPVRVNFKNNFFEKRQAFDIVDAESDTYQENLLLESSVHVREGVATLTEKWLDNDFANLALSNDPGNPPINWAPNFGAGVQVFNGTPPTADKALCESNFANGELPPFTNLLPDLGTSASSTSAPSTKVEKPEGKPTTCSEALVGSSPPPPPQGDYVSAVNDMTTQAAKAKDDCKLIRDNLIKALQGGTQADIDAAIAAAQNCQQDATNVQADAQTAQAAAGAPGSPVPSNKQTLVNTFLNLVNLRAQLMLDRLTDCLTKLGAATAGNNLSIAQALGKCALPSVFGRVLDLLASRVAQLDGVAATGLTVQALSVEGVQVAQAGSAYTFAVQGAGIAQAELDVYDVSGRRVYHTETVGAGVLRFAGLSDRGQRLANGVYIYRITVKGLDGSVVHKISKLVVLR